LQQVFKLNIDQAKKMLCKKIVLLLIFKKFKCKH